MNREEQIKQAAIKQCSFESCFGTITQISMVEAFIDGAKYADSHPKEDGVEMWVARDFTGVHLFEERPHKKIMEDIEGKLRTYFHTDTCRSLYVASNSFSELTFENSPMKVRLTLVKE